MSVILTGFFKCGCGKLHCYGGVTHATTCPGCGRDLWFLMLTGQERLTPRDIRGWLQAANRQVEESWQRHM